MRKSGRAGAAAKRSGSPKKVVPQENASNGEVLSTITCDAHVRVSVNDLVAYEYVETKTNSWKWGLGTVASIPGPRLVQLMLWAGSGGALPPEESPISEAERAEAVSKLEELLKRKKAVEVEMEDLNKTITVKQAHYNQGRAAFEEDAVRAKVEATEAKKEVKTVKEQDWREIRSYVKPPDIVKLIVEATLIVLGERIFEWHDALKVIRHRHFLKRLIEFDEKGITAANLRLLQREYTSNPRFTHEDAMQGSHALGVLQRWVVAQATTVAATTDVVSFDMAHKREKEEIDLMEQTLRQHQKQVLTYSQEESILRAKLGDPPVVLQHSRSRRGSESTSVLHRAGSAMTNGSSARKKEGRKRSTPELHSDPVTPPPAEPAKKVEAVEVEVIPAAMLEEPVHGTTNSWTFTDESKIVLHSSILVNYDQPKSTVITLTEEQVAQLKDALKARAPSYAQEQQEALRRKKLQDEVEGLRGVLAEALKELAELKAAQVDHDAELAAKDRELEEAREAMPEGSTAKSGLPSAKVLAGIVEDKDKIIDDLKSQLGGGKPKKNRPAGVPMVGVAEKDITVDAAARDESQPGLFQAGDDRQLAKIIDRLEREIRILRQESTEAHFVLESVGETISMNSKLKKFMEEDDVKY